MKTIFTAILLLIITFPVFSELTNEDIDKIREVIKQENAVIQSEMVQLELRITQKIQESENRLRAELNAQLNARMSDFTIVFAITSGGFFLMFATILILNMVKGRTIVEKKAIILLVLSVTFGTICYASSAKAQVDRTFNDITCRSLTIVDRWNQPRIMLRTEDNKTNISMVHIAPHTDQNKIHQGKIPIIAMQVTRDHAKLLLNSDEGRHTTALTADRDHAGLITTADIKLSSKDTNSAHIGVVNNWRGTGATPFIQVQKGNQEKIIYPPREAKPNKDSQPLKPKNPPYEPPKIPPPDSDWLLDR